MYIKGVQYLLVLVLLSVTVKAWSVTLPGSGDGPNIDDEDMVKVEGSTVTKKPVGQVCSPCQCQCHYPHPLPVSLAKSPKASNHVDKQLMAIHAALDTNTALLHAITKQVDFVQHDLESPRDTGCPDDFLFDRKTNTCLQFHVDKEAERLDWAQAQRYCQHLGPKTHLAIIDTPDKLELVAEHLHQADLPITADGGWDRSVCIGGMQGKDEGSWFWAATGEELSHQTGGGMWGITQPDNDKGNQNCLALAFAGPSPNWMFDDVQCLDKRLYICERHLD